MLRKLSSVVASKASINGFLISSLLRRYLEGVVYSDHDDSDWWLQVQLNKWSFLLTCYNAVCDILTYPFNSLRHIPFKGSLLNPHLVSCLRSDILKSVCHQIYNIDLYFSFLRVESVPLVVCSRLLRAAWQSLGASCITTATHLQPTLCHRMAHFLIPRCKLLWIIMTEIEWRIRRYKILIKRLSTGKLIFESLNFSSGPILSNRMITAVNGPSGFNIYVKNDCSTQASFI